MYTLCLLYCRDFILIYNEQLSCLPKKLLLTKKRSESGVDAMDTIFEKYSICMKYVIKIPKMVIDNGATNLFYVCLM